MKQKNLEELDKVMSISKKLDIDGSGELLRKALFEEAQVEDSFENKSAKVRNHIRTVGYITSWEAIEKYSATRLSAIIFNAKKENGGEMNIGKYDAYNTRIDERGKKHTTRFAVYYDADKYTEDDIHLMSYL